MSVPRERSDESERGNADMKCPHCGAKNSVTNGVCRVCGKAVKSAWKDSYSVIAIVCLICAAISLGLLANRIRGRPAPAQTPPQEDTEAIDTNLFKARQIMEAERARNPSGDVPEIAEVETEESPVMETPEPEPEKRTQYVLDGSDSRYVSRSELVGFTEEQCRLARNELYARHGRKFQNAELQAYFNSCDWYSPTIEPEDFKESAFNAYEVANRDLIVAYEKEMGYR